MLANEKTQAYPLGVKLSVVLQAIKHLEEGHLVFGVDANPGVCHAYYKLGFVPRFEEF